MKGFFPNTRSCFHPGFYPLIRASLFRGQIIISPLILKSRLVNFPVDNCHLLSSPWEFPKGKLASTDSASPHLAQPSYSQPLHPPRLDLKEIKSNTLLGKARASHWRRDCCLPLGRCCLVHSDSQIRCSFKSCCADKSWERTWGKKLVSWASVGVTEQKSHSFSSLLWGEATENTAMVFSLGPCSFFARQFQIQRF